MGARIIGPYQRSIRIETTGLGEGAYLVRADQGNVTNVAKTDHYPLDFFFRGFFPSQKVTFWLIVSID